MNLYNRIIKHQRNMDVAYLVERCFDAGHKLVLKVSVVNMGFNTTYPLAVNLKFDINKEDLCKWDVCEEPYKICIRYAEWSRLK